MNRVLGVLRAPAVRWLFLALALGLAAVALVRDREAVADAIGRMGAGSIAASAASGVVYVVLTMLAWRAVLLDLGSSLPLGAAARLFFVSQLGKYVPGGIWNILAAAELGAEHRIPRRRSLTAMMVTILVSIVTGMAIATLAVALAPPDVTEQFGWAVLLFPAAAVLLVPTVLNKVLTRLLRLARRPPLEHPITARGTLSAVGWSLLAWCVAGLHVWILGVAVGLEPTLAAFALVCGGYALAWIVGFLVVVVPAGIGAREAVLLAALLGQLDRGGVLTVVLMSRVLLTAVDVGGGLLGIIRSRRR